MPQQDGAVYINCTINTDGVDKGVKVTEKKFKGMTENVSGMVKKIAGLMAGAFAVGKLIQFGKEAINLGSDLAEVQNVVDVTFGDLNGEINDFAKNAIKQFGLSETSAKQFASTMGAMLKSMGLSTREAADMGMSIAGLAGDLASFYNLDAEEAFYKIRSGISGETEPLKQLGINLSVANLEQFALTQGITKSYNAMTQQEQALLRYNYLLSVTSDAQGDFARTSNGWANQTRILSEQFNSLKATLGQGLINLLTPLLKQLNQLIAYLQEAGNAFLRFTQILTGAKATEQAASGVQKQAEAFEEVTEATEEAEKAQNNYLTGLDEIHKFTDDSAAVTPADTTPAGTSTPALTPAVDFTPVEQGATVFDMIADKIKEIIKLAKKMAKEFSKGFKLGFGDSFEQLTGLKDNLKGIGQSIGNIFADSDVQTSVSGFVTSLAQAIGAQLGAITSIGATVANTLFGGIRSYFDKNSGAIKSRLISLFSIGDRIGELSAQFSADIATVFNSVFGSEAAQGIVENVVGTFANLLGGVGEFLGGTALGIINQLVTIFADNKDRLSDALGGSMEGLESITSAIRGLVGEITETILPDLRAGFDGLLELLTPLTDFLKESFFDAWENFVNPAMQDVSKIVTDVKDVLDQLWNAALVPLGNFLKSVFMPIIDQMIFVFDKLWNNILKPIADFVREIFVAAWDMVVAYIKNYLIPYVQKVISIFQWLWEKLLSPIVTFLWDKFNPAFSAITNNIKGFINGIKNNLSGLLNFITGIFSGDWSKAWEGIKKAFKGVWDSFVNIVKAPLNLIIGLVNGLLGAVEKCVNFIIKGLNKLSWEVPDWVPVIGGKRFGFNIKEVGPWEVPYLATGAVIPPNAPFTAVLGDQRNGKNLEAPEGLIRKIIREEMGGQQGFNGTIRVPVVLDGRTITEVVIDRAMLMRAQSGKNPFALA